MYLLKRLIIMNRRLYMLFAVMFCFSSAAMCTDYTHYLMAYFTGKTMAQEQIRYALSTDGTNFSAINGGNPVVAGADIANAKAVRDPYITRGHDGDEYGYYMCATDMTSSSGTVWTNKGLVIMRSKDMINWEHKAFDCSSYFSDLSDVSAVWAPEIIWDATAGKYMIYYALKSSTVTGGIIKIYYSYISSDFTSISTPVLLYCYNSSATIDADIIEHNGTYYMFFKSEASEKRVRMTSSTSLTDWSNATASVLVGQIDEAQEGPCIFQLIGKDQWILMYDLYGRSTGTFHQCTTTDFSTFTAQGYLTGISPRHGAVMWLTDDETTRLQTWSKLNVLLSSLNSDDASSTEATAAKTAISGGETSSMQSAYDALLAKVNEGYTDVTSTYISNAGFETSPIFDGTSTGTSGSVNATAVTGSTLSNSSYVNIYNISGWTTRVSSGVGDYARTFTMPYATTLYVQSNSTAGGQAVTSPSNGSSVTSSNNDLLFVEASWSNASVNGVYQTVTLPAGKYRFTYDMYVGTSISNASSLCGVSFGNKINYAWPATVGSWTPETVDFVLNKPTAVTFSMGYTKTANVGGGSSPFLYVDNLKLQREPVTSKPTASDPIDMTADVWTAKTYWSGATGTYTAATPNNMVERYGNSAWDGSVMSQLLSGYLADGMYDITMYCDASQAWISTPTFTDGATGYTSLYANSTSTSVPIYKRTAVTTADVVTVSDVEITNDSLTIGIRNDKSGANWIIWQIKALTYKGPKVDVDAYNAALEQAQKFYAAGTVSGDVRDALKTAIGDTPTAGDSYSYSDKTQALLAAVASAKTSAELESVSGNVYTSVIKNHDIASTDGWTINQGSGNHATTSGDPAVSGDTTPYMDSWATTWSTQYNATQTVSGLPNGTYLLTATVRSNIVNGISVSASSGSNKATAYNSVVTSWNTISVKCDVVNDTLIISVDSHLSNGGWLSADDFTLTYLGTTTTNSTSATGFKISSKGLTATQAEAALKTFAQNGARIAYFDGTVYDGAVTDGDINNVSTNANLIIVNSDKKTNNAIHVNKGIIADGWVLTDRCPFYSPADFTGTLSYSRSFTSNGTTNYGTVLLPVSTPETTETKLYEATSLSGSTICFTEVNPLPANTPGIYSTTASSAVNLSGTNITATPSSLSSTYLIGCYEHISAVPTGDFVLAKNQFFNVTSTVTLAPFRAYITIPSGAKSLSFVLDNVQTSLDETLKSTPLIIIGGTGYITLKANDAVNANIVNYAGQQMKKISLGRGDEKSIPLPAGLYIVNGSKIIVK